MVGKLRLTIQHLLFLVLTYGGRAGIHLGYALPCFSCPFVSGCGGNCYLMALQGHWWGLQMSLADMMSVMGLEALGQAGIFILLVVFLNKFWCGWICPFGTVQDWLTYLRRRLAVREAEFSWLTRDRLKWVKYVLLAYLVVVPLLIAHAGWHPDLHLPFCKICPAKPIMPLFVGETRHLALDSTNTVTLVMSALSVMIAGGMLVGIFFKERFFCYFCPMLVLIHLFRKVSPVRFEKEVNGCTGCGNCQRMCPMDLRRVYEEKTRKEVLDEDCLLCMTCVESCPADGVLSVKFWPWSLFASSRQYLAQRFSSRKGPPMIDSHGKANQRRQKRLDRVRRDAGEEYRSARLGLEQRPDYHPVWDYFLDLLVRPLAPKTLQEAVGRPLVEHLCNQAPFELFHAMGVHPFRLGCGCHAVGRLASSGFPALMCPMLKASVGMLRLTDPDGAGIGARIVPTTCDWVVKFPEMVPEPPRETCFLDLPHRRQSEKGERRWLEEVYALVRFLENQTGKKLRRRRLLASVRTFMEAWGLLGRLIDLRRQGRLAGGWFMVAVNSFMLDTVETWTDHLHELLDHLAGQAQVSATKGIFLAGSPIVYPNLKLPDLIEAAGMAIRADDLCTASGSGPGRSVSMTLRCTGF